jgi:hypothetical protein
VSGSDHGVRLPSTGKPVFVMTGIDRPGGGVRLYASRELPDLFWGMREAKHGTAWHVDASMQNVLVIDAATWGEAFSRAFEIWANHDRAKTEEAELQDAVDRRLAGRKAISGRVMDGPAHGRETPDGADPDNRAGGQGSPGDVRAGQPGLHVAGGARAAEGHLDVPGEPAPGD